MKNRPQKGKFSSDTSRLLLHKLLCSSLKVPHLKHLHAALSRSQTIKSLRMCIHFEILHYLKTRKITILRSHIAQNTKNIFLIFSF